MTTKAGRERRGTAGRWFSSSQAARYLGVSVDTIRDLDESGELQAERTKGGHRRFSREKLDAYLGKTKRGRSVRPEAGPRRPPPRAARAQRIPAPPDAHPADLELMDEEVLQPYRDEVARGQQETQDQRRVQALIDYGKRYASDKAPFDWESEDRDRALRDVERMLKDSVEPDWTEQRVKDAVDDQLDEREEEPDDDDEDDEDEDEDDENDENEEETDEF